MDLKNITVIAGNFSKLRNIYPTSNANSNSSYTCFLQKEKNVEVFTLL